MKKEEIQEIRRNLSVSQEKFAQLLGSTVVTINRWENGKTRPSRLYIKELKKLRMAHNQNGTQVLQCKEELRNVGYGTNDLQLEQTKESFLKDEIQESSVMTTLHQVTILDQCIQNMFICRPEMGVVMTVIVKTLFRRKAKDSAELEIKALIEKKRKLREKVELFENKHLEEFKGIFEEFNLEDLYPHLGIIPFGHYMFLSMMGHGDEQDNLEEAIQERVGLARKNTVSMSTSELSILTKIGPDIIEDILADLKSQGVIRLRNNPKKHTISDITILKPVSKFF